MLNLGDKIKNLSLLKGSTSLAEVGGLIWKMN
jgi:hypothetical protein